jgi:aerobic-type carbon monoxide dehydrogenase small subunit (CoxS/CutS family)
VSEQFVQVSFSVNGERHDVHVACRRTLVEVLREDLELTGTHVGCEQGVCGACTVVVDGAAVRSCLLLAAQADGCRVETVEGLGADRPGGTPGLHRLQEKFWNNQGLQCGFCTAGFLMTVMAAVREMPGLTRAQWRQRLSGNVCRCTGYQSIVDAVCAYAADGDGERR